MRRRFRRKVRWMLWPFVGLWRLVAKAVSLTGRLVGAAVGFVLLVLGAILSATIIGALVGVPLMILGGMICVRSLF